MLCAGRMVSSSDILITDVSLIVISITLALTRPLTLQRAYFETIATAWTSGAKKAIPNLKTKTNISRSQSSIVLASFSEVPSLLVESMVAKAAREMMGSVNKRVS